MRKGAISALDRGPKVGGQVMNTQIVLHNLTIGRGTADSFIMAVAAQCVQKVSFIISPFLFKIVFFLFFLLKILINSGCKLLEPIMSIQIIAPSDRTSKILTDLGKRRATILDVNSKGQNNKVIYCTQLHL